MLRRAGRGAEPAYRVFDDHGEVLALRADMTVPIARLVATRYAAAEPPLRFCYVAHAYRAVRPHRGQMREFLQAGIELIGAPGARRHGRGAAGAVPGAGRGRPARLPDRPGRRFAVPGPAGRARRAREARERLLARAGRRATSWASSARCDELGLRRGRRRCCSRAADARRPRACSTRRAGRWPTAVAGLRARARAARRPTSPSE